MSLSRLQTFVRCVMVIMRVDWTKKRTLLILLGHFHGSLIYNWVGDLLLPLLLRVPGPLIFLETSYTKKTIFSRRKSKQVQWSTQMSFSFFMSQDSLIVKLTISQTRSSLALGQISDPPTVWVAYKGMRIQFYGVEKMGTILKILPLLFIIFYSVILMRKGSKYR